MLDKDDSRAELIAKISITDDPKELLNIYMENTTVSTEILSRLLGLKAHTEFITLWNKNFPIIKKELKKVIFTTKEIKEISESEVADEFLLSLLDLALAYEISYESFQICLLISEIIQFRKQFPSKAWMISYFTLISNLFKSGLQSASYLNALHILNEYQAVQMSKIEFDFYVKVAQLKSENVMKDLFCGIKPRELNKIELDFTDSQFVIEPIWNEIFNLKVANNMENISFLMKNNLIFQIKNEFLLITPGTSCKFISRVFEIANSYKPIVIPTIIEEKVVVPTKLKEKVVLPAVEPVVTNKIEFKNRFSNLYKKFKLIHYYATVKFNDEHFDLRNQERVSRIKANNASIEKEKERLSSYSAIVDELKSELKRKIEIKLAQEREKANEQAKLEEEAMLEERKANLWRNKSSGSAPVEVSNVYTPPVFSFKNTVTNDTGIYRPNFAAIDLMMKSKVAKTGKPESESSPAPAAKGSWIRKKPTDNSSNQTK